VFPVLPTLLTLGNAACGFGSITFAMKTGPAPGEQNALFTAGLLIFVAMVFDMLDGYVARWARQTTEFGAQLDSLCDVVSFGVAPALLMLKFPQVYHPRLLWVIAVLYMVCAVLRLARFNLETGEEHSHGFFTGLPSPGAAGAIASVAVAMPGLQDLLDPSTTETTQWAGAWLLAAVAKGLPVLVLVVACLMVSRIRYPHVTRQLFRGRRNFRHLLQLIFAGTAIVLLHELAIPVLFCLYVAASPVRTLWTRFAAHRLGIGPQPSVPAQAGGFLGSNPAPAGTNGDTDTQTPEEGSSRTSC